MTLPYTQWLFDLLQAELVLPLKDPTSDMAVIARNGSKLVKEVRDKKEANKSRARFWEVAGSKMGKITGALRGAGHMCVLTMPRRRLSPTVYG